MATILQQLRVPRLAEAFSSGVSSGVQIGDRIRLNNERAARRATEQALAEREQQKARAVQLAMQKDDFELLDAQFPELSMKIRKFRVNQQRDINELAQENVSAARDQLQFRRAETVRNANAIVQTLGPALKASGNPMAFKVAYAKRRAQLQKMVSDGILDPQFGDLPETISEEEGDGGMTPEGLQSLLDEALTMRGVAQQGAPLGIDAAEAEAARAIAREEGNPNLDAATLMVTDGERLQAKMTELAAAKQQVDLERAKARRNVTEINLPATKGEQSKIQSELRANSDALSTMAKISDGRFGDNMFGPLAAGAQTVGSFAASIDDFVGTEFTSKDSRQWMADRQELRTFSKVLVADLLRKASGLAMTESERTFLLSAFGDIDNMDAQTFRRAQNTLQDILSRQQNRNFRLLQRGFGALDDVEAGRETSFQQGGQEVETAPAFSDLSDADLDAAIERARQGQ